MSSDPRSGARSSGPEAENPATGANDSDGPPTQEFELSLATLVQARGATLLDGLELHVPGSRDHADGVASYGFATAVELGLERAHAEAVRETARLHEIGKVYVPAAVLARQRVELSPHERALLDSHPHYGAELARGAGIPDRACEWIEATRERFGAGGLAGERIPLESRIIRVACVCDTLLAAPGPRGSPHDPHRIAIAQLRGAAGRDLDPRVVDALVAMLTRVTAAG